MKNKKLLIAGGVAIAGGVLIYLGYKYVVKPVSTTTSSGNTTKETTGIHNLNVSTTMPRSTSSNIVVSDRVKGILEKQVLGLGNAYLLN